MLEVVGTLQPILVAIVATGGVVATAWASTRDLALRRRLDSTDKFLEIVMLAHGKADLSREVVSTSEQIAAIHLLVDFTESESHLSNAARAVLWELAATFGTGPSAVISGDEPPDYRITQAVRNAINRLDGKSN